ncbi:hypothetical protein BHE90_017576, partial [Fusarium euwallaceae]
MSSSVTDGDWCRHWFILCWVIDGFVMTHQVERLLADCLVSIPFRFWATKMEPEDGVYHLYVLLHIDPEGHGLPDDFDEDRLDASSESCP